MGERLGFTAWFQVDDEDDEMIVLAEPIFEFLDKKGFSYRGPHQGRRRNRRFEMEFSFCTKADSDEALHDWLGEGYLCP